MPAAPWEIPASARRYRLEHAGEATAASGVLLGVGVAAGAEVCAGADVAVGALAAGALVAGGAAPVEFAEQPVASIVRASTDPEIRTRLAPENELVNFNLQSRQQPRHYRRRGTAGEARYAHYVSRG